MTPITALYHQAAKNPDQPAFSFGDDVWTYRRLMTEAECLARAFLARGVQPGDRVALHMLNVPELAISYYACFRAGIIAAPLNTRLKTAELRPLLKRLRPALYLAQSQLYSQVAPIERAILAPEARFVLGDVATDAAHSWADLFRNVPHASVLPEPAAEAPAVLLATSGTTGEPKFVTHTAATLSATADMCGHLFEPGKRHIAVSAMPMVHCGGCCLLLICVRLGIPLYLPERFQSDAVLNAIEAHRCTWILGAPSMFSALVETQRIHPRKVDSLKICLACGDVCAPELQQQFSRVFGVPLRSLWGTTEAIGSVTYGLRPGAVSRITPGAEVRLVGSDGIPTPLGEVGELLLRGPNVATGYWIGPDRIEDPTCDGWFHTGDLMRRGDAQDLWFIARKKDLIIRGGSNIAPSEVEHVLMAHPAVRDSAVFGIPDPILGQRVGAAIQLMPGSDPDVMKSIIGAAKTQLADYKLPEVLKVVDTIPRNALGKADRALMATMFSKSAAEAER